VEFPVRCFSCGSVLGHNYDKYKELIKSKTPEEALDDLGVRRYCCRRMFMSHVDIVNQITRYPRI
jgi:DNA-directed RNA polymerase subunit N